MLESYQKSTGTGYTPTVALLAVAFVFSPALLFISRPFGYGAVTLAAACSTVCAGWAWINWKKSSQLSMPSIMTKRVAK
ncbi:MAG: hypothetical protein LAP61_09550 [Acidobacteriia bacterium]|nr:hypothetical protein [Terriglobia bacterium]